MSHLWRMRRDEGLQLRLWPEPHRSCGNLAVLEQQDCRNASDAVPGGEFWFLIHVDLAALTVSPFSSAISARTGASIRQGPHHGAQKSTRTGLSDFSTSASKFVFVIVISITASFSVVFEDEPIASAGPVQSPYPISAATNSITPPPTMKLCALSFACFAFSLFIRASFRSFTPRMIAT